MQDSKRYPSLNILQKPIEFPTVKLQILNSGQQLSLRIKPKEK